MDTTVEINHSFSLFNLLNQIPSSKYLINQYSAWQKKRLLNALPLRGRNMVKDAAGDMWTPRPWICIWACMQFLTGNIWVLWPSSLKLYGSRRTKQKEVIKKQNGMSHLIDKGPVRGNRKGEQGRKEQQRGKETKCKEKVYLSLYVYVCLCLCLHMWLTVCIYACACVYCVCVHVKGL